ncbi:c-type cytochrome biogenesis protein CcmI [Halomonas halocynthiae]|uniref:c-type cytochrome biogenesis protein CcmI n=1 Tax=Halomonas halocynthiae TaxID=176290 RepID=UPI000427F19B|nr:c-type cytochrome biogenesis protein CcmI [Halomonas halocynthiae]
MILLWLAFAILLIPALWLVILPLRRAGVFRQAQVDYETRDGTVELNLAVHQRRLASLEAAFERGEIDRERYDNDRTELERSLLDDTASQQRRPLKAAGSGKPLVPVLLIGMAVAGIGWYQVQGAAGDLSLYQAQHEVLTSPDGNVDSLIARLEQEAQHQPGNPNVWRSLYPLYRDSGRTSEARSTLEQLIVLEGRKTWLVAELSELRYFTEGRNLNGEVGELVDEVLAKESAQPKVLGILGIDAYESGEYEQAIAHWRNAIAGMSDPNAAESLRQGIKSAQQRLGVEPETREESIATGSDITLEISLAPSLSGRLPDATAVFVVARDTAGELPPLAIQRATLAQLPLTLTLNDTHAMAPGASLSQVDNANIVVRVSASGQATPQPGDLMGQLEGVAVGSGDAQSLVIDQVIE